jgi:4-hydroxybenzoate polyprenyltransferase
VAGLAWALWMLTMLGLAAILWLRQLLVYAGRPELMTFDPLLVVGMVSAATAGAVVASRRPAQPVGWLLLALPCCLSRPG